jgi:serine/threonine protein kinase
MTGHDPKATPPPDIDPPTVVHPPERAATDNTAVSADLDVPTQIRGGPPTGPLSAATPSACGMLRPAEGPGELGRLGPYRVFEVLGAGGMGFVYRAEDTQLQRPVALKVLKPHLAEDAEARQRFLREARAAAALKNDHVVTIYQVGEDQGVPYLAMELMEGMGLDQWLKRGARPTLGDVLRIGREIAAGLDAAHRRGLIHRDIKPGNVWLERIADPSGQSATVRVKVLDFGLARVAGDDVRLTQTGAVLGTPSYMSPEQARGEHLDQRSDLFSLGSVLYTLCTGLAPFRGETTLAVLTALAVDTPQPVRDLNPTVPSALAGLISRLLAKAAADRPATAAEVIAELRAIERATPSVEWVAPDPGASISALPTRRVAPDTGGPAPAPATGARPAPAVNPLLEELLRRSRRNRRGALLAAILFLGALGAAAWLFGPLAYRFATNQGVLVVRSGMPNAEVVIWDDAGKVVHRGPEGSITWKAGTWKVGLVLRDELGAEHVLERKVTLPRGGTVTIDPRDPAAPPQ